jgi:hypothetical protein
MTIAKIMKGGTIVWNEGSKKWGRPTRSQGATAGQYSQLEADFLNLLGVECKDSVQTGMVGTLPDWYSGLETSEAEFEKSLRQHLDETSVDQLEALADLLEQSLQLRVQDARMWKERHEAKVWWKQQRDGPRYYWAEAGHENFSNSIAAASLAVVEELNKRKILARWTLIRQMHMTSPEVAANWAVIQASAPEITSPAAQLQNWAQTRAAQTADSMLELAAGPAREEKAGGPATGTRRKNSPRRKRKNSPRRKRKNRKSVKRKKKYRKTHRKSRRKTRRTFRKSTS